MQRLCVPILAVKRPAIGFPPGFQASETVPASLGLPAMDSLAPKARLFTMGSRSCLFRACLCASSLLMTSAASAAPLADPLRFFAGVTESVGTMKAFMRGVQHVRSIGHGTISEDGTLTLVQQVHDQGEAPHQRTWKIHQVSPTKFIGTMSEAVTPVLIEQIGQGYRFRFKLHGGLSAEQWIIPSRDGKSGTSTLVVKKLGMIVARSTGIVRRIAQEADNSR
jgi:hypothetical protein